MVRWLLFFILVSLTLAKTYPVVEPDPIEEISKLVNPEILEKKISLARQKVWEYKATYLPPATQNATRSFKPVYCLQRDIVIPITDRNWKIEGWRTLYPKGYCFNPLEYLNVAPPPMVIFNPSRKKELQYVQKVIFPQYPFAIYILTGINLKTAQRIAKNSFLKKIHWYFLNDYLVKKLQLKYTISIVSVNLKEKMIEINLE